MTSITTKEHIAEESSTIALSPFHAKNCPVCGGNRVYYEFSKGSARVLQCADCHFTYTNTLSSSESNSEDESCADEKILKRYGNIENIIKQIIPRNNNVPRKFIVIEHGLQRLYQEKPMLQDDEVFYISLSRLDASNNPLPWLRDLRSNLDSSAHLIFIYSDVRFAGIKKGSREWEVAVGDRYVYLDTHTVLNILFKAGFICKGARRLQGMTTLAESTDDSSAIYIRSRWRKLLNYLPKFIANKIAINSQYSDVAIYAKPRSIHAPQISVVIPVYNEITTVAKLLDMVLRVEFQGAKIEIVIVESNSTDGTRQIVKQYENHPRIKCIYEDRPMGKGHATRVGLENSSGDIIIIQDADLEYDVEDYHALIEPILAGRASFVLGSRHGGKNHWKLRQFGTPLLSKFYNLSHVLVTAYINLLFGLRLRDPQTMYKVVRRDCIEGLRFHGNYFNFDYELLLKVVRKGYVPIEVPVNYRSRSHAEGKKIRMWRDAPLGLWMITKLRFIPIKNFLTVGEPIE